MDSLKSFVDGMIDVCNPLGPSTSLRQNLNRVIIAIQELIQAGQVEYAAASQERLERIVAERLGAARDRAPPGGGRTSADPKPEKPVASTPVMVAPAKPAETSDDRAIRFSGNPGEPRLVAQAKAVALIIKKGRLAPDATIHFHQRQVSVIARTLAQEFPQVGQKRSLLKVLREIDKRRGLVMTTGPRSASTSTGAKLIRAVEAEYQRNSPR